MPILIKPCDGFDDVLDVTREYKAHFQYSKVRKAERRGNQILALYLERCAWCVEYTVLKNDGSGMFDLLQVTSFRQISIPHTEIDADKCLFEQIDMEQE